MGRPRKKIPLHERLKIARQEKNISIDTLTKEANITYVTYGKIEAWITDNPTIKNLARIARRLEVSIDELVQDMDWDDKEE